MEPHLFYAIEFGACAVSVFGYQKIFAQANKFRYVNYSTFIIKDLKIPVSYFTVFHLTNIIFKKLF